MEWLRIIQADVIEHNQTWDEVGELCFWADIVIQRPIPVVRLTNPAPWYYH